jgi:hypothetical protein
LQPKFACELRSERSDTEQVIVQLLPRVIRWAMMGDE